MDPKAHVPPALHESAEHEIRRAKIKKMQEEGLAPWPSYKEVTSTTHAALEAFEKAPSEKVLSLAGRLLIKRDHGKTFFGIIQDRSGKIQIYIKKDDLGQVLFDQFKKYIDIGDIVWVQGPLFVTQMGETTLKVEAFSLMSKCLFPLPEKFHGLTDTEQRYRQRYLDLISNPESREKFKKRSHIIQSVRNFLVEHDFLEVETPMLHPIPGGATARPFVTHHNAYDMELYLRIAPELYLKRLVVGGLDRVFEINRNFRNEGISTRHNPEFTMLEFYMAYGDYHTGISMTEQLISRAIHDNFKSTKLLFNGKTIDFTPPFKQLSIQESLITIGKLTPEQISSAYIDAFMAQHNIQVHTNAGHGVKLFALFEHFVEPNIVDPTFITHYPIEVSPLAKRDEKDPSIAARFELFVCGMECANGFTELNDPFDQAERFQAQVTAREGGDQEAHYFDADYIKALEYGLPPAVGVGIGIDRLVMLLTDTASIKDVILFPTLKSSQGSSRHKALAAALNTHEKPSVFIANQKVLERFNNPRIAVSIIKNADNTGTTLDLHDNITSIIATITKNYTSESLSQDPTIAAWREAYKTFGSKPSEFPSSIESLYKRVLRNPQFNAINPLVDIYNYISLKYMLPAGGEDLDNMRGAIELTYATAHEEPVTVLGKDKPEAPYEGEVIYKDSIGTICRRWNWREVKRTILTPKTHNALIVLEALGHVSTQHLKDAQQELTLLIEKYCKAEVSNSIIDQHNNTIKLNVF